MFKKLLTIALLPYLLAVSINASAKDLTNQELKERFQINADVYQVDSTGQKLLSGPLRTNYWRLNPEKGSFEGNWSSGFEDGIIALRHNWKIEDDGSIKVSIEEFSEVSDGHGDPEFKGSLGKKDFNVENFQPVTWKVNSIKSKNYIVRFIPSLRQMSRPMEVDNLPISGSKVTISDNNGFLWTDEVDFNGKYVGITTHRGTIILSYSPFLNAKEMGTAELNQITLNIDKKYQINLKAESAFLPASLTAKVYAMYLPERKSKGVRSVSSFDSNKVERIKQVLDRK